MEEDGLLIHSGRRVVLFIFLFFLFHLPIYVADVLVGPDRGWTVRMGWAEEAKVVMASSVSCAFPQF